MKNIILAVIISITSILTLSGLLTGQFPEPYVVENLDGQPVEIFGSGLYQHESTFKAPILKGTDFVILFFLLPCMTINALNQKKLYQQWMQLGFLTTLLYYSFSTAFSTAYNPLFILYLVLFSCTLFIFIHQLIALSKKLNQIQIKKKTQTYMFVFILLAGSSVFVWLIDIITSIKTGQAPSIIGLSTTEPTYIIDLGIVAPSAFLSAYWLKKHHAFGLLTAYILIFLNAWIGVIVIAQSISQYLYGIFLTLSEIIPFVIPFVFMSFIAFVLLYHLNTQIKALERKDL